MARSYSKYEYETSPRKLEPYYAPKKDLAKNKQKSNKQANNSKKQKAELKLKFKIVFYLVIGFGILFAISYRNAQIDENFGKVQTLKSDLAAVEKKNAQLEVSIESTLNLTNLEQQARNILGMQKLTNKQTGYINLPKSDYTEVATEQVKIEENKSLIKTVIDFVTQLFK